MVPVPAGTVQTDQQQQQQRRVFCCHMVLARAVEVMNYFFITLSRFSKDFELLLLKRAIHQSWARRELTTIIHHYPYHHCWMEEREKM